MRRPPKNTRGTLTGMLPVAPVELGPETLVTLTWLTAHNELELMVAIQRS